MGETMAKRFRETGIWKKRWYRELGSAGRDLFNFLADNCDHAGIWDVDMETMSFFVGFKVELGELIDRFGSRIQILPGGEQLFIPGFIEFQYGELHPESKPHQSVISRLKDKGLWKGYTEGSDTPKDKDKDKDTEEANFSFEALYQKYPRKVGKTKGMAICHKSIKSQEDFTLLDRAIDAYRNEIAREKTEPKFVKHFSTFMNCWRDYAQGPPTAKLSAFAESVLQSPPEDKL
jgi:hypothetical protein